MPARTNSSSASETDVRYASVEIPANAVPYYFELHGSQPLELLTREQLFVRNREAALDRTRRGPEPEAEEEAIPFQVTRFTLHDEISTPGCLELDVSLGTDLALPIEQIVGQPGRFGWACGTEAERHFRYFHGIVVDFAEVSADTHSVNCRMTVMPRLWRLSLRTRCRIFQNATTQEIISQLLDEHGLKENKDFFFNLTGQYDPREYCVQYRESDLNFASRLLEEDGVYYYIEHTAERDVLHFIDALTAHEDSAPFAAVLVQQRATVIRPADETAAELGSVEREEYVEAFHFTHSVHSGQVRLRDYDFRKSTHELVGTARSQVMVQPEFYDYPGLFLTDKQGKSLATIRQEELDVGMRIGRGNGDYRSLAACRKFRVDAHPRPQFDGVYLCASVTHFGTQDALVDAEGRPVGTGTATYECEFGCIPDGLPYRPPRRTPRPVVAGIQTAEVVGPQDEEIYTDEYGRIKVKFHWDLDRTKDENSSCWLRVVNRWADGLFGTQFIPRIGQEVVIEFLEGDPDRPIVNGCVYNDQHKPPFALPGNKTQSGLRTRSTPKSQGSNELRFEDAAGKEQVYIHGEKDLSIEVKNNISETASASVSTSAGGSISRSAHVDISRTADQNINDKAGINITTDSGKNMSLKAGGSYSLLTNLGIHLKTINFVMQAIISAAEDAAKAVKDAAAKTAVAAAKAAGGAGKEAAKGGAGTGGIIEAGAGAAGTAIAGGAADAGHAMFAALSPGIDAGVADLKARTEKASEQMAALDPKVNTAIEKGDALRQAIESGEGAEAIAEAAMAALSAAADAYKDAKAMVEGMLPQIPSIVMWAMKDIKADAMWSMSLATKIKDITLEAKNANIGLKAKQGISLQASTKDVNVKAKKKINLEAETDNLSLKAAAKDILLTGSKNVQITAEKNAVKVKAAKDEISIEAEKRIVLKCGSASITMKKGGDILIKGKKITHDASQAIENKAMKINDDAKTKHQVKSVMVEAKSSGMNVVKGSVVRIN